MKTRSTKEMMVKYSAKAMGCAFLSAVCLMGAPRQMSYASETEITEAAVQTMSEAAQAVAEEIQALEIHSREEAKALVPLYVRYNALSAAEKESISEDVKQLLEAATETAAAYNHSDQGVTVTGDIPWYTQIQVSIREDASESVNGLDIIVPYDIVLWDLYTDSEYVLNGETVTIGIPKPDVEVDGDMKILHYLHDGSMEELTPEVNGGMLYFQTDSFSPFSLAGQTIIGIGPGSSTQADDETETDDTTSSTDTNSADTNTTNTDTNTTNTNNTDNTSNTNNTSSTNNTNSTGSDSALGTKDAPAVNSQNDGTTSSNSSTGSSSASGTVSTDPALTGDMTDIWPAVIAALSALLVIGATILTGRKERVEKNEQK